MADDDILMNSTPPVMGMGQKEYVSIFTDHEFMSFSREWEDFEDERRRKQIRRVRTPLHRRPEFYAILIGSISLAHGLFVQWAWPWLQHRLQDGSPYKPT
ncbi:hypothetical protein F5Y19DRAFT_472923 [Xylariaceae sp. FL1651]|nr:hypothetical protein F5Y19DRAFT_472923 [Xylariaceae sp. FL1651]